MNVFATSACPLASARALDDSRVIKMALESAQLLCTELGRRGYKVPYRPTHANHPVTLWLRDDGALRWLFRHFVALCDEYAHRFGRTHKSYERVHPVAARILKRVPEARKPSFANCARRSDLDLDFTDVRPTTEAYRRYLRARWELGDPRWTRRSPPRWL